MNRKGPIAWWLLVMGLTCCVTLFLTLAGPVRALAATEPAPAAEIRFVIGESRYSVDGEERLMDALPFIEENRTYVPVKYLAEAMGALAEWEGTEQRVTLTLGGKRVDFFIGRPVIVINGEEKSIPVTPLAREGRTYLPARFVVEAFGYKAAWESSTHTVVISRKHWQSYRMVMTLRIGNIDKLWMPVPREWDGVRMTNVRVTDISPQPDELITTVHSP